VNHEQEIEVLKRQVLSLRREVRALTEWQEVLSSPVWKRVWFVLCGWRWNRLGRWYRTDLWKG
jgi:hypothetical protein